MRARFAAGMGDNAHLPEGRIVIGYRPLRRQSCGDVALLFGGLNSSTRLIGYVRFADIRAVRRLECLRLTS